MKQFINILFVGINLFIGISLFAQPYTPQIGSEVVAFVVKNKSSKKMKELNIQLLENPKNEIILDQIISLYLQEGRALSDPRYFGYAQAILKPYLADNPSYRVQMHHVDILQHQHHFVEALVQLERIIKTKTSHAKPYLTQAIIYASFGEYDKGLRTCKQLIFRASHLLSTTCITKMQSHLGKLPQSYALLKSAYQKDLTKDKGELSWTLSVLTQMSLSLGEFTDAKIYIHKALELNPKDYYMLGLYADLLLEDRDYFEVVKLLADFIYVDALLLRLTIAQKKLSLPEAKYNIQRLKAHFISLEQREEKAHLRDRAIFTLYLEENPQKAYILAKENYALQKEQGDYAIYEQSAKATNRKVF